MRRLLFLPPPSPSRTLKRPFNRIFHALQSDYLNDIYVLIFKSEAVMKADIITDDRGELLSVIEPLVIGGGSPHRAALTDLALDLVQKSAGFRRSLLPAKIGRASCRERV